MRKTRALTDKPFGNGVVMAFPHKENIKAMLDENFALLQVAWGEFPVELVREAHQAGVKIVHQVGSYEEVEKVGVDAIIVQGREVGGHVIGQDGLMSLLPRVVDAAAGSDIPVISTGSIVDGTGYIVGFALGAQGICIGTRKMEDMLDSFADRVRKPRLFLTDKMQITLGDDKAPLIRSTCGIPGAPFYHS